MAYGNKNLDRSLAVLGVILSLIYISIMNTMENMLTGIFVIMACVLWLLIRKSAKLELGKHISCGKNLILILFFFVIFMSSILSIYWRQHTYERPLIYFILTSIAVGIIALEVLYTKYIHLILFQIIIIVLSLELTQQLIFPSVVGIDPGWHRMFTLKILDSGNIPIGYGYSNFPMMHIYTAIVSLMTSLDYKVSTIFSVSIIQVVSNILFIYILGTYMFNEEIGLMSSLLLGVANYHIFFGWWSVPNTFASVFILIIIYILLLVRANKPLVGGFLYILFMISLILTHELTAFSMAIILFVIWAVSKFYNDSISRRSVTFIYVMIFFIFMFFWWSYVSGSINLIARLITSDSVDIFTFNGDQRVTEYYINIPLFDKLFRNIGFTSFFALSIVGCLYVISKKHVYAAPIVISGSIILIMSFLSIMTGKEILNTRWLYFSQILLAMPVSITFLLISNIPKRKYVRPILIAMFAISLSFIMIISPTANADNFTFNQNLGVRYGFTDSEMKSAAFYAKNTAGKISSDFDYSTNPSSSIFVNYYNVSYDNISSLDASLRNGTFDHDGSIKIIRKEIVDRPFRLSGGLYRLKYDPNIVMSKRFNKIYDSFVVIGYE